jgi:hypothetical protein
MWLLRLLRRKPRIEAKLSVIESALREALQDYSTLRRGGMPHYFELEAGTQSCEEALSMLQDVKAAL